MQNTERNKTIRNIVIFTVVVLLSGWIGVLIDRSLPEQPQGNSLGMAVWLILPLIASLLLRAFAGDGWRDIGFLPRLKGNIQWYIVSFLIYPTITVATATIGYFAGWIDISGFHLKTFLGVFAGGLLIQFIKNIFEESVWRGYLTCKLTKAGAKDHWLYLIVGGVWGFWHLPYYLVFIPIHEIQSVLPTGRLSFALIAVATMIFWTVMYTEIYLLTHSIWPLVIVHMVEDALTNPLVIQGFIRIEPGKEILISPIIGIITTLLYLAVGLILRRYRVKYKPCKAGA